MRNQFACCISLLLLTGCDQKAPSNEAVAQSPPNAAQPSVPTVMPTSEVGRFVIVHSPQTERDTVLLDTETGQTWELEQLMDLKGEPTVWTPMNRMDTADDWNRVIAQYGEKAQPGQIVSKNTAAEPPEAEENPIAPQQ